jgi:hypothetical protein
MNEVLMSFRSGLPCLAWLEIQRALGSFWPASQSNQDSYQSAAAIRLETGEMFAVFDFRRCPASNHFHFRIAKQLR